MKMNILALMMSAVMFITTGCGVVKKPVELPDKPIIVEDSEMRAVSNEKDTVTSESVKYLINAADENMAISPVSMKGAMALVALSTEGVTQEEIIKALGCESVDDVSKWYTELQEYSAKAKDSYDPKVVEIANAIWLNTDNSIGSLHEPYRKLLESKLGATSDKGNTKELANTINAWADEKTHGLIKQIVTPETLMEAVLALSNATYLKGSWAEEFYEIGTKDFKGIDGCANKKDFVSREVDGKYYKDDSIECTTVPIGCGLQMVMAKGDQTKIFDAMNKMTHYDIVHIEMPKMEIESSWEFKDIKPTLEGAGIKKLFNQNEVEFTQITEGNNDLELGTILQKCKVLTDEKGIEAAAVTVVTFDANCVMPEEEPTRAEFIANEPYYFYVYLDSDFYSGNSSETDSPYDELLFCGKCVN